MNLRFLHVYLVATALVIFVSQTAGAVVGKTPPINLRAKIQMACFEVVTKKPEQDSLSYEKKLPWELVNYNIRNDRYIPLGTAFAISARELVTAAHVMQLMDDSPFHNDMYIRDADGNVFPIDTITSFHNAKDFVKFTIKGKALETWFSIRQEYAINEEVLAVGNIYGEGLVTAPGTLLGTLPEPENGQWLYLKSSPPNDFGSSGGPLLDLDGNVLGIIVAKNDNFSYSLPIQEMESLTTQKGIYHSLLTYGFNLFPERIDAAAFDLEVPLPSHYREVKKTINRAFAEQYRTSMDRLFGLNSEQIFPNGSSSQISLNDTCDASDIQVLYKDNDDLTWYFSELEKEGSSLGSNGSVMYSNINSTLFIDLVKPDDIPLKDLYRSPKLVMELILKGINLPREVANQQIRILSLGAPMHSESITDTHGRRWGINLWGIEYSNEIGIMYSTPTPDGMVCLLKFVKFVERDPWLYDLKRTLDFVYIPYYGTLEQWREFLTQKEFLYGMFLKARLDYKPGEYLRLTTDDFNLDLDTNMLRVTDKSQLSLLHDFYDRNNNIVWGVRKVIYSEEKKDNYFVMYRHVKPRQGLPDRFRQVWETVVQKEHPYDEVSYVEEGRTNVGALHPMYENFTRDELNMRPWIDTLYLGQEGKIPEEKILTNFGNLKKDIRLN